MKLPVETESRDENRQHNDQNELIRAEFFHVFPAKPFA
jgi:hypothetical protein